MKCAPGFSLLELLMTLIIVGIIGAYGLSSLTVLLRSNQAQVIADEIKQAIQFAKIEALIQDRVLVLAPLLEDGDWSQGMRLFEDNQTHQYTPALTCYREWRWHAKDIKVTWRGFESTAYLRFTPDLLSRRANGQFILQQGQQHQMKLVLNRLGRVKTEKVGK